MSERNNVTLRLMLVVLAVANVMVFAYSALTPDTRAQAGTRIEELQINPGRIRLLGSATRGPGAQAGTSGGRSGNYRACLEWGPFSGQDLGKADSALARLTLPQPPVQRPLGEADGSKQYAYFVREPEAEVVAQIAELQRTFPGTAIKAGPCPPG
jgi:hypothetical protein